MACNLDSTLSPVDSAGTDAADAPPDAFVPTTLGTFTASGSFLHARAGHASVALAGRVVLIGGQVCSTCAGVPIDANRNTRSIETATIDADGNFETFQDSGNLVTPRAFPSAFVATGGGHTFIYVVAGLNATGAGNSTAFPLTVERAEVTGSGVSAFATYAGVTTIANRAAASVVVQGSDVYLIGGTTDGGGYLSTIEHATIDGQGELGPFTTLGGSQLSVATGYAALAATETDVFMVGGYNNSNATTQNVQHAPLSSGTLGGFELIAGTTSQLTAARGAATALVLGDKAFVLGGADTTASAFDTIDVAPLGPPIGQFVRMSDHLDQVRCLVTSHVVSPNRFCIFGGSTTAALDTSKYVATFACAPLI